MSTRTYDCRDTYSKTLLELAKNDRNVIVVVNDSVGSSISAGTPGW